VRVLVACERSGIVREACNRLAGVTAYSCDLEPCEDGRIDYHIVGDVRDVLDDGWDAMFCFPECRYLSGSGLHWNNRGRGWEKTEAALDFAEFLWNASIPRICLENPVGILWRRIGRPSQSIQPYQFGHDASKRTCLWLKNMPRLRPTKFVPGRIVTRADGSTVERWANQTDSGQNRLPPGETRSIDRARTYPGIADAMATQLLMRKRRAA